MSPRFRLLLTAVMLLGVFPVGFTSAQDADPPPVNVKAECQQAVTGMNVLLEEAGYTPEHLMEENASKQPGDFDVNRYFDVLDHLAMEEGYILDYVYLFDGMGGFPVLFPYPEDEPPLTTMAEFRQYFKTGAEDFDPATTDYQNRVVIDDTPAGYLQMVVLDWMANQFYLFWHAGYNDWRIICDADMLTAAFESAIDDIPLEIQADMRAVDLTPTVTLYDDYAVVRMIAFTAWGGLFEWTATIDRAYPRTLYEWERTNLVEYQTGIVF